MRFICRICGNLELERGTISKSAGPFAQAIARGTRRRSKGASSLLAGARHQPRRLTLFEGDGPEGREAYAIGAPI